jgi:DNA-directed RNA polymerase specialized sigma24 family protein
MLQRRDWIMESSSSFSQSLEENLQKDQLWEKIIYDLHPYILRCVYTMRVASWRGQEEDLAEDIVQLTLERVFIRQKKSAAGEAPPIEALLPFCKRTARNLCLDLKRKDERLVRLHTDSAERNLEAFLSEGYDPIEDLLEVLDRTSSLIQVAYLITGLRGKQKTALLMDLAHRTRFSEEPTPLEVALAEVHIILSDYLLPLPVDPVLKNRYTSSLSLAYKKLRELVSRLQSGNDLAA